MSKRQIGPFILERKIGVGGMGIVYLATYPKTGKKVAVKILSPALIADKKLLSRFEREIAILKRLKHPNIVKYYGGGTENQQRYYAMQFIDGGSLYDVLKKRGKLSWEQAIHVGRQVCSALEHAHNAGIIHRDLKPANLFLTRKGRLMLGDFGIARDTEATALTAAGKTVGTYAYMAPEQIQGGHPISRKTDLYALGCLLFEVLTGETPFTGSNAAEMLMQHLNSDPPNVSELAIDCPVWLDQLIDEMLAKNPDDRPYDALAVHTRLGEIRDQIAKGNSVAAQTAAGSAGRTKTAQQDLRKALRRKKKRKRSDAPFHEQTWFLAGCLVGLVAVTAWLMWPASEADLFAEAQTAMRSDDEIAQREAFAGPITEYLERFPEGVHASEMKVWADEIQVDKLEAQLEKKARGFGEPSGEAERRYIAARQNELSALTNPMVAIEQYSTFLQQQQPAPNSVSEDHRHLMLLFGRRLEEARANLLSSDRRLAVLRERMQTAEALFAEEKTAEADRIWQFAVNFLRDEDSLRAFREYAEQRLVRRKVEPPGSQADGGGPSR